MGRANRPMRLFHSLRRSLWVLPMAGCVAGTALAFGLRALEGNGSGALPAIEPDAARALLGTVAGATATVMSLTYTLTLVVFTLAAGQLGPRLLDSFYDNRVNQTTITTVGTTFVFATVGLWLVTDDREPGLTAAVATALSVASVAVLIYFVHDVARRVLVDNEIALTAKRLRTAIRGAFRHPDEAPGPDPAIPEPDGDGPRPVMALDTGYLRSVDIEELVADMAEHDAAVEIAVPPGAYVLTGSTVAFAHRDGSVGDWEETVHARLAFGRARSSEGDILFHVNLLVEIALRALSPGVNDSFTAVSVVDHLSGAFADLVRRRPASPLYADGDGVARVRATVLTVEDAVDTALHPIRRSAAGNVLVCSALLRAIRRLARLADPAHGPLLRRHADLIARAALPEDPAQADRAHVERLLREALDAPDRRPLGFATTG